MDAVFFDSLFEGDSANGVKLGAGLTGGDFWAHISGCSLLYRGAGMESIDFENILAVGEADAEQISPPDYVTHANSSTCFYVVRRANACGEEEKTLAAAVRVKIDADGDLVQGGPNSIFEAKASQTAGNKVELVWFYCPIEQQSLPANFNIYFDSGTGQVDYETAIATVSYLGRKFYSYQSGTLDPGNYLFAVRVEDVNGVESASLAKFEVQLDASNPDAIDILSTEVL